VIFFAWLQIELAYVVVVGSLAGQVDGSGVNSWSQIHRQK